MAVLGPKATMELWVKYMNSHEPEKLAELYAPNAENLQVAIGKPLIGRDAILKDFREFFKNIPDTFTEAQHILEDGDWAVVEWKGGGTFHNPESGERRPFHLSGCGFFKVVGGLIQVQRGYWCKHTWFSQVGLPL